MLDVFRNKNTRKEFLEFVKSGMKGKRMTFLDELAERLINSHDVDLKDCAGYCPASGPHFI